MWIYCFACSLMDGMMGASHVIRCCSVRISILINHTVHLFVDSELYVKCHNFHFTISFEIQIKKENSLANGKFLIKKKINENEKETKQFLRCRCFFICIFFFFLLLPYVVLLIEHMNGGTM